jgi:glyoxylase-like metal-dependent hydrolase (beta-lactamase superfamily II)
LEDRPYFPNATYRCDAADWHHFVVEQHVGDHYQVTVDTLQPIVNRVETFSGATTLIPGVDCQAAPGHTPGSVIVVLSDGRARALLLGDVVHCPVELLDDEWAALGDVDPVLARQTRNALVRELEAEVVPVAAAHFPGLRFGRLLPGIGGRRWLV